MIGRLDLTAKTLSRFGAYAATAILAAMLVLILAEIMLRTLFATSTQMAEEFVGFGLAAVIFLALGSSLDEGRLIRVDLVLSRLSPRWRRGTEIAIVLVALSMTLFIQLYVYRSLARFWTSGAVSWSPAALPLWIPQAVYFAGLWIFTLQLVAYLARLLTGARPVSSGDSFE